MKSGWGSAAACMPVAAAARMAGCRGRVLLHSGRDDDGCGRWSFATCAPERTIEARGRTVTIRDARGAIVERGQADPLQLLEREVDRATAGQPTSSAPLPVAIGYLGYDLGRTIERLPPGPELGDDVPDLWFGFYSAIWRRPREGGEGEIVGSCKAARERLATLLATGPERLGAMPTLGELVADDSGEAHCSRVDRVRDYICAGDVYQVNIARRLVAAVHEDGDALALYASLLDSSPAAFGALIETDRVRLLSGSPELFLARKAGGDRLETRPIKGTRRRTGDASRDRAAAAELASDGKELAEHLMIVDLERNDLGRIAETGSVAVDDLGHVVELPTLYHMVSTVSCRARAEVGLAEILRATFPGGSITGAPKIRAMEIIDELEPARRGPYTGAIGYFGAGASIDLSIAIRTVVLTAAEARLHVGGGIVADSTPARELEETEEKAAGWRRALSAAVVRDRAAG